MDLLIGVFLLLYFCGAIAYGVLNGFDTRLMIQVAVCGVGSLLVFSTYIIEMIKNIKIPKPKPNPDSKKEKEMDKNNFVIPFDCDDHTMADFKALHYLKERALQLGSDEALQMVIKLNSVLFSSDCSHGKQKADKNEG
jgi:hypothetical protein